MNTGNENNENHKTNMCTGNKFNENNEIVSTDNENIENNKVLRVRVTKTTKTN